MRDMLVSRSVEFLQVSIHAQLPVYCPVWNLLLKTKEKESKGRHPKRTKKKPYRWNSARGETCPARYLKYPRGSMM